MIAGIVLKRKIRLVQYLKNTFFGLKNVLDRIPRYRRTVLKEECLYLNNNSPENLFENDSNNFVGLQLVHSPT